MSSKRIFIDSGMYWRNV